MKMFAVQTILALIVIVMAVGPATASAQEETLRVATWNLEWFFDADTSDNPTMLARSQSAPDQTEFDERVDAFTDAVQAINPTIIALQEIENRKVVQELANRLQEKHNLAYQVAFVQGRDTATEQDVAFLVKQGIPFNQSRFSFSGFAGNSDYKDLTKHLKLEVTINGEEMTLVTVHLITRLSDRLKQAKTLRAWTEEMVAANNLIILGDFNTGLRFQEVTPGSDIGIIRGFQTSTTADDLFDTHQLLNPRQTHVSGGEFDHILISPLLIDESGLDLSLVEVRRDLAIRGAADTVPGVDYALLPEEQDLSDHFPVVATFSVPVDRDAEIRAQLLEKITDIENELARLAEQLQEVKALLGELED